MRLKQHLYEAKKNQIYCDMDGVLTDFDKASEELYPDWIKIYKQNKDKAWDIIDKAGTRYWANMRWTKDGKRLWDYIKYTEPIILSAYAKNKFIGITGKKEWLTKNISINVSKKSIIIKKENKQNYAGPNKILIDDSTDNIKGWKNKGGIGILHRSTNQTIKELSKLGI